MQLQIDIDFDQLVQLAKRLPVKQWTKLKQEVETQSRDKSDRDEFRDLLLGGPTFSQEQLDTVLKPDKIDTSSVESLFGAYKSDDTADEIIAELRSSRVSNRNIELL